MNAEEKVIELQNQNDLDNKRWYKQCLEWKEKYLDLEFLTTNYAIRFSLHSLK